MLVSAEVRWFWKNEVPQGVEAWFRRGVFPPGGGKPRIDEYVVDPTQRELGIKKRGGGRGVEVKGLVDFRATTTPPLDARVQVWSKWTSASLTVDHLPRVAVRKTRWLRRYDTGGHGVAEVELDADEQPRHGPSLRLERGCHFELVSLRVGEPELTWWSMGFEAFGPLDTVEESLHQTVAHAASAAVMPSRGLELSYPAWLAGPALSSS
jgi:hypothetical protein